MASYVLTRIRTAYAFRQVEQVRELSNVLINLPLREHRIIGQYYLVWCQFRECVCDYPTLEGIIEQTRTYKSKALIWRAGFDVYKGDFEAALYFYAEALKANPTVSDYIVASRGLALAKSMEGFHASALRDLERLIPLLSYAEPMTYCDVLNSYAVELIEAKRLSEAETVSSSVVSSPFAPYYPEWRETHEDIKERRLSRAKATFSAATALDEPKTLLHMPVREPGISVAEPFIAQQRAAVFDMQAWKKRKMSNQDQRPLKPTTNAEKQARLKELENIDGREILMQIMSALADESVADDQLRKALAILEGVDEG